MFSAINWTSRRSWCASTADISFLQSQSRTIYICRTTQDRNFLLGISLNIHHTQKYFKKTLGLNKTYETVFNIVYQCFWRWAIFGEKRSNWFEINKMYELYSKPPRNSKLSVVLNFVHTSIVISWGRGTLGQTWISPFIWVVCKKDNNFKETEYSI